MRTIKHGIEWRKGYRAYSFAMPDGRTLTVDEATAEWLDALIESRALLLELRKNADAATKAAIEAALK